MITELQAERDRLDHAILALERLSEGKEHKRGRPPKWLKLLEAVPEGVSKEPPGDGPSPRGRKATTSA